MVDGKYQSKQVLTLTLLGQAGTNPSYLIVRTPEEFRIPIHLEREQAVATTTAAPADQEKSKVVTQQTLIPAVPDKT